MPTTKGVSFFILLVLIINSLRWKFTREQKNIAQLSSANRFPRDYFVHSIYTACLKGKLILSGLLLSIHGSFLMVNVVHTFQQDP